MQNKTVLVTGASRGIGRATALAFAKMHYNVIITSHSAIEELNELKDIMSHNHLTPGMVLCGDISNETFVRQLFTEIQYQFQGLDVLINNAAISKRGLFQDTSLADWNRMLATNLTGPFLCCREAVPLMLQNHRGSIVNVSSVWGAYGASCEAAYSASKGGLNAFTRALARELAPSRIRVNAVACGAVDTRMNQFLSPQEREELEAEIPAGRMASCEEIADSIYAIATGHSYMTGQIVTVDGGWK